MRRHALPNTRRDLRELFRNPFNWDCNCVPDCWSASTRWDYWLANGRAPHYAELADALEIGAEQAREVQRAAVEAAPLASCWLAHDTDYVESWAPFSNVPTHYLISVDGIQKWYGQ